MNLPISASMLAPITVVPLAELEYSASGPTRGHAHIGLPNHPSEAPGHLDFAPLRLFAVGIMEPGETIGMHRHEGIDDLLIPLRGRIRHRDALGGEAVLSPRDAMLLSAGSGVEHAAAVEGDERVVALVIWLEPDDPQRAPEVHLRPANPDAPRNYFHRLAGPPAEMDGAMPLASGSRVSWACVDAGARLQQLVAPGRRAYLMSPNASIRVNGQAVETGARVLVPRAGMLDLEILEAGDLVLVDLPES